LQSALRAQVCPTCTDLPYAHSTFRPTRTPCTEKHTAMSSSSSEEDDIVRRLERVHASCPSPIDAPTTATTLAAAPVPGAASAAAAFSSTPHSLFSHHVVSPRSRTPPHLQLGTGRRKHRAPTPSAADLLQKRVAQEAQQHARAIIVLQEPTTPTEEELEQMVRTPMQNLADSAKSCLRKLSSLLLLSLSLSLSLSFSLCLLCRRLTRRLPLLSWRRRSIVSLRRCRRWRIYECGLCMAVVKWRKSERGTRRSACAS
jgi:hypothetical protein